jgi:sRNA-binding protein
MSSTKRADTNAAIALLCERFPRAFFQHEARRKPLAIGIRAHIITSVRGCIAPHELTSALARYCGNAVYLSHLRPGVVRVGLDGSPAGFVTAAEAQAAAERAATQLLKAAARRKARAASPEPVPAGQRRITLHDLKQLAVLRRQGEQT